MSAEQIDTEPAEQLIELLTEQDLRAGLQQDALRGLRQSPKWLPPKYFYDDRGSELFEQITRLPEYYPTRAEHALLTAYADQIAAAAGNTVLLELGSGSSTKTRLLLDAMQRQGLSAYVPADVSAGALRAALESLRADYPRIDLIGAVADFDAHLGALPAPGSRLIALLGGTIGNYPPSQRQHFLASLAAAMRPGESFLLGADLVKDPQRLIAAYDDSAGVTAEFNRNVLRVLNRELDGDFDPDQFEHVAVWDHANEWIEMRLRARTAIVACLRRINLPVRFAAGEQLRTEISAKFRREGLDAELCDAGLTVTRWWQDDDFALVLARK